MSVERDIRFDLIARLCPNTTGAELRSVATEVSFPARRVHLLLKTQLNNTGWHVRNTCPEKSSYGARFP